MGVITGKKTIPGFYSEHCAGPEDVLSQRNNPDISPGIRGFQ